MKSPKIRGNITRPLPPNGSFKINVDVEAKARAGFGV